MSQMLPYDEIEMRHGHPDLCIKKLEGLLNTPDDADFGYFREVDLKYLDKKEEKTKNFPFCPENKKCNKDDFSDYMNEKKPDTYTKTKNLVCDWTDKKKYLIHYRMLKYYVGHGMVVEKIH